MEDKINEQIKYIESKWFVISNLSKVKWYLRNVWYYRLKRYYNSQNDYDWVNYQEIIEICPDIC